MVRHEAQEDFDKHTQTVMKDMVWTGACRSWCKWSYAEQKLFKFNNSWLVKKGVNGKVTALWPGSSLHYMQVLAENRWEDYKWEYCEERFSYWGQGISWVEDPSIDQLGLVERESMLSSTTPQKVGDISYYLWASEPILETVGKGILEGTPARAKETFPIEMKKLPQTPNSIEVAAMV